MPAPNTVADFWRQVQKSPRGILDDGCWLWTGSTPNGRYGRFGINGGKVSAHRYSWELHFGPVPEDMDVLHRCDVTLCVRPSHLFLGTHTVNMHDMFAKRRRRILRGADQAAAKVTDANVRKIRADYAAGARQVDIAAETGIDQTTVSKIVTRKAWTHVK